MKIVDVSGFYSETGGGVASYVRQKFDYAARSGHDVTVVAPGSETRVEPRAGGRIAWVASPPMPFDDNYRVLTSARSVWRAIAEAQPDVVEGSSPWRGGWLAGRWPGPAVKSLVFHQDFVAGYPYTLLGSLLEREQIDRLFGVYWAYLRRLSSAFDVTVAGGDWLAKRLKRFHVRRPVPVPFGIESEVFSPAKCDEALRRSLLSACGASPEGRLLLAVGRFHPEKQHRAIIGGFVVARAIRPDMGLVLVGDGPIRASVEKWARRAGHVHLAGATSDRALLARCFASADLLVHGSGAETYGLVVAEAIASGLAVVAPDSGGAADLARGGASRLYATGDASACGAAILETLAKLDQGRLTAAPASAPMTAEAHFQALFELYEALIEEKRVALTAARAA